MASLGNLFFSILYKDNPEELENIKKRALAQLKDIEVKVNTAGTKSSGKSGKSHTEEELGYVDALIQRMKNLEQEYRSLSVSSDGAFPTEKANQLSQSFTSTQNELRSIGKSLSDVFAKSFSEVSSMSEKTIGDMQNKLKFLNQYKLTIPLDNMMSVQAVDNLINKLKASLKTLNNDPVNPFVTAEQSLDNIKAKISALTNLKNTSIIGSDDYTKANAELERLIALQKELLAPPPKTFDEVMGMDASTLNGIKAKLSEIRKLSSNIDITPTGGMGQATQLAEEEAALIRVQKEHINNMKVQSLAEGSIGQLRAQLSNLIIAYDQLSRSQREAATGKGLLENIQRTTIELGDAEEASMRYQRNVGNYKSGFNGLTFQVQQLARELPSIAYGANIFFAAISNNLPMFTDEVKNASEAYKKLKAEQAAGMNLNQKAVPVYRQILSSIFSWQTAIVAVVTLLTLYGGKLTEVLFKTNAVTKAQGEFFKSLKSGNNEYGDAIKELTRLENLLANIDGTYITAKEALDEYNNSLGKAFGHADNLTEAHQNIINKKEPYINAMLEMAKATFYLSEMQKKAGEAAALSANKTVKWYDRLWRRFTGDSREANLYSSREELDNAVLSGRKKKAEKIEQEAKDFAKIYADSLKEAYDTAADAEIDLLSNGDKASNKSDKANKVLDERIQLLQEAYNIYKEFSLLIGGQKALPIVQQLTTSEFDPQTFRKTIQSIYDDIKSSPEIKGKAGAILFDLDKQFISDDLEQTKLYIEKTIAGWDLFSDLFKKTGNIDFASNAAFGGKVAFKNVLEQLKGTIQNLLKDSGKEISIDDLFNMSDTNIKKVFGSEMAYFVQAYKEQNKIITDESLKNAAELLSTYKNYEQQRKDIIAKGEKDIADLILNGASQEAVEEANKRMSEALASLDFKEFKDSDLWAKAFEDLDRLSTGTIDSAIDKLEEFSNTAGKDLPINEFKELMNILKKLRGEFESRNPFKSLIEGIKSFFKAGDDATKKENAIDKIKDSFKNASPYLQSFLSAFGSLSSMFDSLGNEGMANAMNYAQEAVSTISNIGEGFAKGGIVGGIGAAVGEAANWIGKLAGAHDQKLDKAIQKSQREVEKLQGFYEGIERSINRSLGNVSGLNRQQRQLMEQQIKELEKQKKAEEGKKKSDKSKVDDYGEQIAELKDQTKYFAEDLANELYGIDFKGWASQLGDALFEAWKKGEDGAEAFKKKSAEILGDVLNNVLKVAILEPMMEDLRKALYGEDGGSGYLGKDNELDEKELAQLSDILMKGSKQTDAYFGALDELNNYMEKNGGKGFKDASSKAEGLSTGIKGIKEDQADILASLANAMRADGAKSTEAITRYVNDIAPEMSAMAKMQLIHLLNIANNTKRNADMAEEIRDMFSAVVSGTKQVNIK